jgi:prepilin-type N-terminal cleavage/methylation domain-containing protein
MAEGIDMRNRNIHHRGFTLVEILIVVIILGVLAGIVIPLFANATTDARRAALSDQLHTVRVQIQLYTLQHGDTRPVLTGSNWDPLITQTFYPTPLIPCGPYLPSIPRNTLNGYTDIVVVNTDPAWSANVAALGTNIGFVYNPIDGVIWGTNTNGTLVYDEANPNNPKN